MEANTLQQPFDGSTTGNNEFQSLEGSRDHLKGREIQEGSLAPKRREGETKGRRLKALARKLLGRRPSVPCLSTREKGVPTSKEKERRGSIAIVVQLKDSFGKEEGGQPSQPQEKKVTLGEGENSTSAFQEKKKNTQQPSCGEEEGSLPPSPEGSRSPSPLSSRRGSLVKALFQKNHHNPSTQRRGSLSLWERRGSFFKSQRGPQQRIQTLKQSPLLKEDFNQALVKIREWLENQEPSSSHWEITLGVSLQETFDSFQVAQGEESDGQDLKGFCEEIFFSLQSNLIQDQDEKGIDVRDQSQLERWFIGALKKVIARKTRTWLITNGRPTQKEYERAVEVVLSRVQKRKIEVRKQFCQPHVYFRVRNKVLVDITEPPSKVEAQIKRLFELKVLNEMEASPAFIQHVAERAVTRRGSASLTRGDQARLRRIVLANQHRRTGTDPHTPQFISQEVRKVVEARNPGYLKRVEKGREWVNEQVQQTLRDFLEKISLKTEENRAFRKEFDEKVFYKVLSTFMEEVELDEFLSLKEERPAKAVEEIQRRIVPIIGDSLVFYLTNIVQAITQEKRIKNIDRSLQSSLRNQAIVQGLFEPETFDFNRWLQLIHKNFC